MHRALPISGVVLLVLGVSYARPQKAPKDQPAPQPAPAKNAAAPKVPAGQPKAGIPKGAARLVNPGNLVTQFYHMTPEQRERNLEKLPPQMQETFRKNLAWFDGLPKEQQQMQLRRIDRFEQLPPEKQIEIRGLIKAANELPPGRRAAVGQALYRLQQMPDQQREATLARPMFQSRFSPEELKIIRGLADAWMGGPPQ